MRTRPKAGIEEHIEAILRGGQFKQLVELYFNHIKESYGLKKIEMEILYCLSRWEEHNTSIDVCRTLRANKGHVSQAMENLRKRGLVEAIQDKEDRRYVHFILLEDAREITEELTSEFHRLNAKLFEGFSEEELEVFKSMMVRVGQNMDDIIRQTEEWSSKK
ncbi:MAG: winged helix-turn-helix transcriptional regulator [Lachnospiraceae bacterium]|nr:winged helix-turn-helix transcriptional regulator [Lachnospiraceae bacterium]